MPQTYTQTLSYDADVTLTVTHGIPEYSYPNTYVRYDTLAYSDEPRPTLERRFAAGPDDDTPLHKTYPVGYDARCHCCWLHFPHTQAKHAQNLEKFDRDAQAIVER